MKKIVSFFLLLGFLYTSIDIVNAQGWERLNPPVAGSNLTSVYFPSKNIGYAVGDCGTLIKTTDAGNTWVALNTHMNLDLRSIFFINDTVGFLIGYHNTSNEVYKTNNGGLSWFVINFSCSGDFDQGCDFYSIYALNNDTIYVAGYGLQSTSFPFGGNIAFGAIARTYDGDISHQCFQTDASRSYSCITATNSNTFYIGGSGGSDDILKIEGLSWNTYSAEIYPVSSISFGDQNNGFTVGDGLKISRTKNAGVTWSVVHTGSSPDLNSIKFINKDTGIAVGVSGTILRTTDNGNTWINSVSGTNQTLNSVFYTDDTTAFVVGNNNTILKTTDGGIHWTQYVFPSSVTANDLNSVSFPAANAVYIVGAGGLFLKSIDMGNTWVTMNISGDMDLYSSSFLDANNGYVAGANGEIFRISDGGNSWVDVSSSAITGTIFSIYFINQNTGYAVGAGGKIIKTTDAGNNWILLPSGTTQNLHSIYFPCIDTGYVVGDNFTVLKTVDAGNSWTPLTIQIGNYCNFTSVKFINSQNGFISGNTLGIGGAGEILSTNDGGNTFLLGNISYYQFPDFYSAFPVSSSKCYVVGDNGIILKTNNGFYSALQYYIGCEKLTSIDFLNPDTGFVVGSGGTIIRITDGVGLSIDPGNENIKSQEFSIYPNPANDKITIETKQPATIVISNIQGQLIKTFANSGTKTNVDHIGLSSYVIDVSSFPSGVYIIELKTEKGIAVKKFVKD